MVDLYVEPNIHVSSRQKMPSIPDYKISEYQVMTLNDMFEDDVYSLLATNLKERGRELTEAFMVGKCRISNCRISEVLLEDTKLVSVDFHIFEEPLECTE